MSAGDKKVGVRGIIVLKANPTKLATTVCLTHTGVGPVIVRNARPKKRLALAARMRGFPKFASKMVNPRLVSGVQGRTREFKTRFGEK